MRTSVILCALFAVACGRGPGDIDETVGAACSSDRDCESRCFIDNEFPGGFCSYACQSDNECPEGTVCISTNGGVCMFACPPFDCPRLGAGWECRERDRQNGGKTMVCSGS